MERLWGNPVHTMLFALTACPCCLISLGAASAQHQLACRFVPVEEAEAFIGGEAAPLAGPRQSSGKLQPNGSLPKVCLPLLLRWHAPGLICGTELELDCLGSACMLALPPLISATHAPHVTSVQLQHMLCTRPSVSHYTSVCLPLKYVMMLMMKWLTRLPAPKLQRLQSLHLSLSRYAPNVDLTACSGPAAYVMMHVGWW